jgi:hypothetical protein
LSGLICSVAWCKFLWWFNNSIEDDPCYIRQTADVFWACRVVFSVRGTAQPLMCFEPLQAFCVFKAQKQPQISTTEGDRTNASACFKIPMKTLVFTSFALKKHLKST